MMTRSEHLAEAERLLARARDANLVGREIDEGLGFSAHLLTTDQRLALQQFLATLSIAHATIAGVGEVFAD